MHTSHAVDEADNPRMMLSITRRRGFGVSARTSSIAAPFFDANRGVSETFAAPSAASRLGSEIERLKAPDDIRLLEEIAA